MILMSVVPLFLLFLMPKLTEGMDEETLKEMRANRQQVSNNVEMPDVSQKLADWFAPKVATDSGDSSSRSVSAPKKRK